MYGICAARLVFYKEAMADTAIPGMYPAPGDVIAGKYRIDRILGEGGMGAVARATHLLTRSAVALKFMSPMIVRVDGAVERFLREGQAAARIRSDHVVQIFDVDKLPGGAPYIAMECMEGIDLEQLLAGYKDRSVGGTERTRELFPFDRAIHITLHILRALQAAHGVGIVHRDMKPSNCFLVTRDGDPDFVKILDFGISKVSDGNKPSATKTNVTLGTPLYMAPEQGIAPKEVDARSDLYAVGSMLYEMIAGWAPFMPESGELAEILYKVFTAEAPPLAQKRAGLPDGFAEVVHKALQRKQVDRYPSALAFAEALAPFAAELDLRVIDAMRTYVPPSRSDHDDLALTAPIDAFERLGTRSDAPNAGAMTQALASRTMNVVPPAAKLPKSTLQVVQTPGARTALMASGTQTPIAVAQDAESEAPAKKRSFAPALIALLCGSVLVVGIAWLRSDRAGANAGAGGATNQTASSANPVVATSSAPANAIASGAASHEPVAATATAPATSTATTTATAAPSTTSASGAAKVNSMHNAGNSVNGPTGTKPSVNILSTSQTIKKQ
jgi:eukaryotic-like serine/threonine-protein kinase